MNPLAAELAAAGDRWRAAGRPSPDVVLVAGSGLSLTFGAPVAGPEPLGDWLPFPVESVAGHDHALELLEPLPGRFVLYYRGRLHAYQGYDAGASGFSGPLRRAARRPRADHDQRRRRHPRRLAGRHARRRSPTTST